VMSSLELDEIYRATSAWSYCHLGRLSVMVFGSRSDGTVIQVKITQV
jgi:hypothetical protein